VDTSMDTAGFEARTKWNQQAERLDW
jgi:hypothetical protein